MISNYIPHKRSLKVDFQKWYNYYQKDIDNLFSIFLETLEDRHVFEYKNNKELYKLFCVFIFNNSSRYIPNWDLNS